MGKKGRGWKEGRREGEGRGREMVVRGGRKGRGNKGKGIEGEGKGKARGKRIEREEVREKGSAYS